MGFKSCLDIGELRSEVRAVARPQPNLTLAADRTDAEPIPLQFVAGSAGHAVLAGQPFDGPGQLQPNRPEQIGRQLAQRPSVALGKRLAPPHAVSPAC